MNANENQLFLARAVPNRRCAKRPLSYQSVQLAWILIAICSASTFAGLAAPVQWSGNGHYYEAIYSPSGITWDAAEADAESKGGHLATISSDAENNFVFSLIDDPKYWIPWPQYNNSEGPWLGGFLTAGSVDSRGNWQWVNNEGSFSYSNWYPSEPDNNNPNGPENRLDFIAVGTPTSAYWNDYPSTVLELGYVIEYDSLPVSVTGSISCTCDGSPIAGASVQIGTYSATTASDGSYSISSIPVGTYTATISLATYYTTNLTITLPPGSSSFTTNFWLTPDVQPADVLTGAVSFQQGPTYPYEITGHFTPANGMNLTNAACVLGVDHFNWIQTLIPPPYFHFSLIPIGTTRLGLPIVQTVQSMLTPPIIDPAPVAGYTYYYRSDLLTALLQAEVVPLTPPSNGKGFYYNDPDEVQIHLDNNWHTLLYGDSPSFPDSFLASGDSVAFTTRLVGVRHDGSYTFFNYHTGFTWKSDAVFGASDAINGDVYGMYSLKETNALAVPPILSGGVKSINYLAELENVAVTNGMLSFSWVSFTGFVFQAQYKTNLSSTNWVNLGSTITASNTVISVSDAIGSTQQRFYRVQQQ